MANSYYFGLFAEYIVILIYKLSLHTILHHRKKSYVGEIDIIALKKDLIVFIEVKARKNGLGPGIISEKQRTRLRNAALFFLSKNPEYLDHNIRFDLAVISPYKLPVIIRNAF